MVLFVAFAGFIDVIDYLFSSLRLAPFREKSGALLLANVNSSGSSFVRNV